MVLKQHRQGCLLNMSFSGRLQWNLSWKLFQTKVFYYMRGERNLPTHDCCHHYSQISDWPSIFFPVSWRKRKKSHWKENIPKQAGWKRLIGSWGYKPHCFPQKLLTLVDFLAPILKIGQCPWSRISSSKPCFQQWKQIISLFVFSLQSRDTIAGEKSFVHLSSVQDYTQVWLQKAVHREEETKD